MSENLMFCVIILKKPSVRNKLWIRNIHEWLILSDYFILNFENYFKMFQLSTYKLKNFFELDMVLHSM
jgi:hypothetical protein